MWSSSREKKDYAVCAYRWTEREMTLRFLLEYYGDYLPFMILVTQGYSSCRAEITADEVYWLREVVCQHCLVVKDEKENYFSLPECLDQKVIPLKRTPEGSFLRGGSSVPLSSLRRMDGVKFFRFAEASTKEVFDGASDSRMLRLGRMEVIDTYSEKLLAGYPVVSDPYRSDIQSELFRKKLRTDTDVIYPQVTLIPAWLPIIVTIATCRNGASDHKFLKNMLEMRKLANMCHREYNAHLAKEAEIMVFKKPPVDQIYDYIELQPLLKERSKNQKNSISSADFNVTSAPVDSDDDAADYELIDPFEDKERPVLGTREDDACTAMLLEQRSEPIAMEVDMPTMDRLALMKHAYDTGILPVDDDPPEPEPPEPPPKPVDIAPELPERDVPPPPLPKREPTKRRPADVSKSPIAKPSQQQHDETKTTSSGREKKEPTTERVADIVNKPPIAKPSQRQNDETKTTPSGRVPYMNCSPSVTETKAARPPEVAPKPGIMAELRKRLSVINISGAKTTGSVRQVGKNLPAEGTTQVSTDRVIPGNRSTPTSPTESQSPTHSQQKAESAKTKASDKATDKVTKTTAQATKTTDQVTKTTKTADQADKVYGAPAMGAVRSDPDGGHLSLYSEAQPCTTEQNITSIGDIPADLTGLSVSELMDCLRLLNMSQHVPALEKNLVDGDLLQMLTEPLLEEHFGFTTFDAKKLVRFTAGWRPKV